MENEFIAPGYSDWRQLRTFLCFRAKTSIFILFFSSLNIPTSKNLGKKKEKKNEKKISDPLWRFRSKISGLFYLCGITFFQGFIRFTAVNRRENESGSACFAMRYVRQQFFTGRKTATTCLAKHL